MLAFGAFGPDPAVLFAPLLNDFKEALQAPPGSEAQVAEIVARMAQTLPAATVLFLVGGTLLLGLLVVRPWRMASRGSLSSFGS